MRISFDLAEDQLVLHYHGNDVRALEEEVSENIHQNKIVRYEDDRIKQQ